VARDLPFSNCLSSASAEKSATACLSARVATCCSSAPIVWSAMRDTSSVMVAIWTILSHGPGSGGLGSYH
jgi:hypothetical protein